MRRKLEELERERVVSPPVLGPGKLEEIRFAVQEAIRELREPDAPASTDRRGAPTGGA